MRLTNRKEGRASAGHGRRLGLGVVALAAAIGLVVPATLALAGTAGAATPTLTVSPDSNLTNGETVHITGSGFADSSEGSALECNDAPGEPTVEIADIEAAPVGCTNPLSKIISTSASGTVSTSFAVAEGVIGPPATGTDSAGNSATTDAQNYPCPPTAAQQAEGVSCTIAVGDLAGDQGTADISFKSTVTPLSISTTSLPEASDGVAYSASLAATGGTPTYTWSITSGSLPTGLSLASDGDITGTTSEVGTYPISVQVADSGSPQQTATADLSLTATNTVTPTIADVSANPPSPLAAPPSAGSSVTFSATVSVPSPDLAPSGSVAFTNQDNTTLCTGYADNGSDSQTTFKCNAPGYLIARGDWTITAAYSGNVAQNYTTMSTTLPFDVGSTTNVSVQPSATSPQPPGKSLVLTATLSAAVGEPAPTGTVTFYSGWSSLCSAITVKQGVATCRTTTTAVGLGSHQLAALYSGDTIYFSAASAGTTFNVKATPKVTLTVKPKSPVTAGTKLTFTGQVTVPDGDPAPTATLKFHMYKTNKVVCTAPVSSAGTGSCSAVSQFKKGDGIWASYTGNADYTPAKSKTMTYQIKKQ